MTALAGLLFSPYIPQDLPTKIGADAVGHILSILAASMLSVTTFSLGIMVSAYSAAANNVTPRATQLIVEDSTTQNVLSTFIGSFLFSLVSIIVLSTGAYGSRGRVILFGVTLAIVVLIVITLLSWINHLSRLGQVISTTQKVEEATCAAMRRYKERPNLGCHRLENDVFETSSRRPIYGTKIGYIQHIDLSALAKAARQKSVSVYITGLPGHFVEPAQPIAWVDALPPGSEDTDQADDFNARFADGFTISQTRSFDQDPRFGMCVLAEIASRALSPGLNDQGTAIDIIGRAVRIFSIWAQTEEHPEEELLYPELYLLPIRDADLFDDIFMPIARDGASILEIAMRLQKAYRSLKHMDAARYQAIAKRHSDLSLTRFLHGGSIEADTQIVKKLAAEVSA